MKKLSLLKFRIESIKTWIESTEFWITCIIDDLKINDMEEARKDLYRAYKRIEWAKQYLANIPQRLTS